jgi:hypothetical protein
MAQFGGLQLQLKQSEVPVLQVTEMRGSQADLKKEQKHLLMGPEPGDLR